MGFDISQDPYQALRNVVAERTNRIVVWCGSGLSAPAGLPTWPTLKANLVSALARKADSVSEPGATSLRNMVTRIQVETNYWLSFQLLQSHLGDTTYHEMIREELRPAATVAVPTWYREIWKLRIGGLLNVNLDRFATRAFLEATHGKPITEFSGRRMGAHTHVLKSPQPFVANLHGIAEDAGEWVFTQRDLKRLLAHQDYRNFVRTCFSTSTVLFLGISADDVAVGGHLEALDRLGIQTGPHYWVTDRRDVATDTWAERIGIRVIRYNATNHEHAELHEFFRDLQTFVPHEDQDIIRPVTASMIPEPSRQLDSPENLSILDPESIRRILNARAKEILEPGTPAAAAEYADFCTEYDPAIYRAWYTSTRPNHNSIYSYILVEEVARGAFGKVYKAVDTSGRTVAIKVLLEEIRNNSQLLHGFRRGVRAMEILKRNNVSGMVAYEDASEIPALVVMNWVDGPNLKTAVNARQICDWQSILRIGTALAGIIRHAHMLPERVLHRDLRPTNVMLEGFYLDRDDWQVVVLDFDLSWHRGAEEKSVVHGSSMAGYLAPEQIQAQSGVSTRHATVDSFGFGMTLYFLISGQDPLPAQHRHHNWENSVTDSAHTHRCTSWRSLPQRFARLIINCTRDRQSERWDMTQVQGELQRL